jgi:hypothetical protein
MKREAESAINPDSLDSEWYVLIPTVIFDYFIGGRKVLL